MTPMTRRVFRSITAPPPHSTLLMREISLALTPLPTWDAVVPDPRLHAYFERLVVPLSERAFYYWLGHIPGDLGEVNLAEYLPTRPLWELDVMLHHFTVDESRTVVMRRETVRGQLITNLIAVFATVLDAEAQGVYTNLPSRIARAAAGSTGVIIPGQKTVEHDPPAVSEFEPAWLRMFGATELSLQRQFRNLRPDLVAADRPAFPSAMEIGQQQYRRQPTLDEMRQIDIKRGVLPWVGKPYHFLNWVWAEHRQVSQDDFAPYGLDDHHWDLLVSSDADRC